MKTYALETPMPLPMPKMDEVKQHGFKGFGFLTGVRMLYWQFQGQLLADESELSMNLGVDLRTVRSMMHLLEDSEFEVDGRLLRNPEIDALFEQYVTPPEEIESDDYEPGMSTL